MWLGRRNEVARTPPLLQVDFKVKYFISIYFNCIIIFVNVAPVISSVSFFAMKDFILEFEKQNPGFSWDKVQLQIFNMIKGNVFVGQAFLLKIQIHFSLLVFLHNCAGEWRFINLFLF